MEVSTHTPDRFSPSGSSVLGAPRSVLFYLALLWGAYLRCLPLTDPFPDNFHGFNGGYMSLIARNWVRYGMGNLKFYQIIDGGPLVAGSEIYTHHPPLVPMLVWVGFKLSGSFSEWCARMVPITFSLGALVLLYLIVRRLWNEWIALLAALCYALMPYATYFANDVCYETGDQFFFLLSVYWYLRYMESPRVRYFALLCATLVLGFLTDWPGLYTVVILGAHWLFCFPGRRRWYFLLYPTLAVVLVGLFLLTVQKAEGTWMIRPIALALHQPNVPGAPHRPLGAWINVVIGDYLVNYCTPVVMALAAAWIGGFLLRSIRRQATPRDVMLLMLWSHGAIHTIYGYAWAYNHESWASVMMPGLAVAAAVAFYQFFNYCATRSDLLAGRAGQGLLYALLLAFGVFCTHRLYHLPKPSTRTYQVAKIFKENTDFTDHILTVYQTNDPTLVRFYADRNIYFGIAGLADFLAVYQIPYEGTAWAEGPPLERIQPKIAYGRPGPAFRYMFVPDEEREQHATLYRFLQAAYRMRSRQGFSIFDLKDPILSERELSDRIAARRRPFDFYAEAQRAQRVGREAPPRVDDLTIAGDTRTALSLSPGVTTVFRDVPLDFANPLFKFAIGLPDEEGASKGDGLIFEVTVKAGGRMYRLFAKHLNPKTDPAGRRWDPQALDLSAFRYQYVDLALTVRSGSEATAGEGGWSSLEITDASFF